MHLSNMWYFSVLIFFLLWNSYNFWCCRELKRDFFLLVLLSDSFKFVKNSSRLVEIILLQFTKTCWKHFLCFNLIFLVCNQFSCDYQHFITRLARRVFPGSTRAVCMKVKVANLALSPHYLSIIISWVEIRLSVLYEAKPKSL